MKFIYHLGVHKTGTTLLQQNIVNNSKALLRQGVYSVNAEFPDGIRRMRNRLRRIQNIERATPHPDALLVLNTRAKRWAQQAGAHSVLVSEENFIGNPIHRELAWCEGEARFCPSAGPCLEALTCGIDPADITIILYTRKLAGLLKGHYSEALRALEATYDIGGFLDRVDIASFRFDDLLARLQAVLPEARFILKPFEAIAAGGDGFVADFFAACGVDASGFELSSEKVNPGITAWQAEQLVALARRQKAGEGIPRLARKLNAIYANRDAPGEMVEIPARHGAAIEAASAGDLSLKLAAELP